MTSSSASLVAVLPGVPNVGDDLVEGHDAVADIDDEEHDGRFVDGDADLPLDFVREIVDVLDAHAAGVDEFEEAVAHAHGRGDAVARHPGRRFDDADAPPGQHVEERRFADVRPAHDSHHRKSHCNLSLTKA